MEKLILAQSLKPQGINGEIKFRLLCESVEDIKNSNSLFLGSEPVTISEIRENNGFVFIKFKEITSIAIAERFRDQFLSVPRAEVEKNLKESEYFIADLIGKNIIFESGEILGVLTDVQNFGSADVFYVKKTNGKEVLFSNVDGVIINVDENSIVLNQQKFNQVSV